MSNRKLTLFPFFISCMVFFVVGCGTPAENPLNYMLNLTVQYSSADPIDSNKLYIYLYDAQPSSQPPLNQTPITGPEINYNFTSLSSSEVWILVFRDLDDNKKLSTGDPYIYNINQSFAADADPVTLSSGVVTDISISFSDTGLIWPGP